MRKLFPPSALRTTRSSSEQMMKVLIASTFCICLGPLQVEAILIGRPVSTFLSSSGASRTPAAFGFNALHNTENSYNLKSSVLLAKKPLRGGGFEPVTDTLSDSTINDEGDDVELDQEQKQLLQNSKYIKGLLENLEGVLDKWIVSGSLATRRRAYNILHQIKRLAMDKDQAKQAVRLVKRSGMPLDPPPDLPLDEHIPANQQPSIVEGAAIAKPMGAMASEEPTSCGSTIKAGKSFTPTTYDGENRINLANERLEWERQNQARSDSTPRSALSARMASDDGLSNAMLSRTIEGKGVDPFSFAEDKQQLQDSMKSTISAPSTSNFQKLINGEQPADSSVSEGAAASTNLDFASAKASELVARAGSGTAFRGSTLGIGGLDDVLSKIQRRVWIPLAAPPTLLAELGIQPVRGLLLYGAPGCGKTLLARKLGSILSPARPITIVSGPEIMDKFVGSSEKNLREIFDNPPELYFEFKKNYGDALAKTALHVIVLDEFDAIARARGGSGGKGEQGDAGVARDSVVNQLLAKMDGVDSLSVPTLLIGLTNKPSLIDPALMRPGRFEVKVEVPKPKTVEQRASILKVHMGSMYKSGRVLVRDAPVGTAAWRISQAMEISELPTYEELVDLIAVECDGMSGASLAGVARAAASRALERAVTDFAGHVSDSTGGHAVKNTINDCLVTHKDFDKAIDDVFESAKAEDYEEEVSKKPTEGKDETETLHTTETPSLVSEDTLKDLSDSSSEPIADKSVNEDEPRTELTGGYADVSEHESITEYFRAGVEIPDWKDQRSNESLSGSGSLRNLLPKRRAVWLKLDNFGRRVEDIDATKR